MGFYVIMSNPKFDGVCLLSHNSEIIFGEVLPDEAIFSFSYKV